MNSTISPQWINQFRESLPPPVKKTLKNLEQTVNKAILSILPLYFNHPLHQNQRKKTFKASKPIFPSPPSLIEKPLTSLDLNPCLVVRELTGDQLKTAEKVTTEWVNIAKEKSQKDIEFLNSESILKSISQRLQFPLKHNYRVFACFDALNQQQAIAVASEENKISTQKSHLYVNLLATNPINIRSSLNKEEKKVTGAGTALISHLAKVCLQENKKELQVTSLDSALPFYIKLGFHQSTPNSYHLSLKIS